MKTCKFISISLLLFFSGRYLAADETKDNPANTEAEATDPLDTELPAHLEKAHDNFLKKNFKAAAAEIREAASLVKKGSVNAKEKVKDQLERSANDLEFLAQEVERGAVGSASKLKSAFAKTHSTISENQYVQAVEEKGKGAIKTTGKCLKSAALHLEKGFAWTDTKIQAGTQKGYEDVKELTTTLAKGVVATPDKIGDSFKWLGKEQKKLWKKLRGNPENKPNNNLKPRE